MNHSVVYWLINIAAALILAPLIPGIINRVKAKFAGRQGQPLMQLYYDLFKLMKKESVYSTTTTIVFRAAPSVSLAAIFCALLLMPFVHYASPAAFPGDFLLFLYLLGLSRIMTVLGAMDTGSSFEGMGSSRECEFSVISEAALIAVFGALAMMTKSAVLSTQLAGITISGNVSIGAAMMLIVAAFFVVMLLETCRVPADDPNTHLELTMIHEAMILDYSGPDLACILYGAALKQWIFLSFLAMLALPVLPCIPGCSLFFYFLLIGIGAIAVGVGESIMARYRFLKVSQLPSGAFALTAMAIVLLILFRGGMQ